MSQLIRAGFVERRQALFVLCFNDGSQFRYEAPFARGVFWTGMRYLAENAWGHAAARGGIRGLCIVGMEAHTSSFGPDEVDEFCRDALTVTNPLHGPVRHSKR